MHLNLPSLVLLVILILDQSKYFLAVSIEKYVAKRSMVNTAKEKSNGKIFCGKPPNIQSVNILLIIKRVKILKDLFIKGAVGKQTNFATWPDGIIYYQISHETFNKSNFY